jgi:hypothetical protein
MNTKNEWTPEFVRKMLAEGRLRLAYSETEWQIGYDIGGERKWFSLTPEHAGVVDSVTGRKLGRDPWNDGDYAPDDRP